MAVLARKGDCDTSRSEVEFKHVICGCSKPGFQQENLASLQIQKVRYLPAVAVQRSGRSGVKMCSMSLCLSRRICLNNCLVEQCQAKAARNHHHRRYLRIQTNEAGPRNSTYIHVSMLITTS